MMSSDLYGSRLILEQLIPELRRDTELRKAISGFLCEMISNLNVDVVRRDDVLPSPALFDDLDKFCGDVDAPSVIPLCLKPISQFVCGIPVDYVDVKLSLL